MFLNIFIFLYASKQHKWKYFDCSKYYLKQYEIEAWTWEWLVNLAALNVYYMLGISQIFGVDINGNGYSWLQSVTLNQNVHFLPISTKNANFAECQVSMLQDPALNAKVFFFTFKIDFCLFMIFTCNFVYFSKLAFHWSSWIVDQSWICKNKLQSVGYYFNWCTAQKLLEEIASRTSESIETWTTMANKYSNITYFTIDLQQIVSIKISFTRIGSLNLSQLLISLTAHFLLWIFNAWIVNKEEKFKFFYWNKEICFIPKKKNTYAL